MTNRTRNAPGGPHGIGPAQRVGALIAAFGMTAALAAAPSPTVAQGPSCDEQAGTLGIQGMACEGCTFRISRSGIEDARFRTEPRVIAVARAFTGGDRLRAGDRIVAIDGSLITTREGSRKLVDLRSGQHVTVRIRRDGREADLDLVAGSACELRRAVEEGEVELERWAAVTAPEPPSAPGAVVTPRPELPPLPAQPPALPPAPSGYLGVAFQCTDCGARGEDAFFTSPPVIMSVTDDAPAARAGLRGGDAITAVNGAPITTPEGARAFADPEPGDTLRLTVRRDDAERTVTVVAAGRPAGSRSGAMVAPAPPAALSDRLRFEGAVGDARVEVRGAPVTVTRDEETGELVIRTAGNVIRVIRTGG